MKIDQLNFQIIKQLQDGRKSFKKISEDLDVTENTIRSRVNRLHEEGILEIMGRVDAEKLPDHQIALIAIKLNTPHLLPKAEELTGLRGVISARVVTGRYDIFLEVLLKKGFGLLEFLSREIDKIQGIQSIETFIVYKGYNDKVPYIL
jgi:Lrp/AsnC family transcriptional regulator, regulator for asnA, asnC and gidA